MGVLVGVVALAAPALARFVPAQQTPIIYQATVTSTSASGTTSTSTTTTAASTTASTPGTTAQSTTTTTVVPLPLTPPVIIAQPSAVINNLATQLDLLLKQLIALLTTQLQGLQQQVAVKMGQQPTVTSPATPPAATAATTTAQTTATSTTAVSALATSTAAANQLPKVNISFPYSGFELTAPASLDVTASAVDDDGAVSNVEFFGDGSSLGTYTGSKGPWNVRWNGISAGAHTLTARVTDDKGGQTTSAPITLTVRAVAQGVTGFTDSPPTITIATTITGTALTATATVTTYAGNITNVVWSRAATSTSDAAYVTDTTSPYNGNATLGIGVHTISAIVTNSQGSTARTASTTVTTN